MDIFLGSILFFKYAWSFFNTHSFLILSITSFISLKIASICIIYSTYINFNDTVFLNLHRMVHFNPNCVS